jgi:hypothetical protein
MKKWVYPEYPEIEKMIKEKYCCICKHWKIKCYNCNLEKNNWEWDGKSNV